MRLERPFISGLSERGLPAETSGLAAQDEESSKRWVTLVTSGTEQPQIDCIRWVSNLPEMSHGQQMYQSEV